MNILEGKLKQTKQGPVAFMGGLALALGVFISMGLTQLGIDFTPPEEAEPLAMFHLPPPPPPPPVETPPKKASVPISFDLPATTGPAELPLGLLKVDFGLTPQKLTKNNVSIDDTIDNFQTDGLKDLEVYDYNDVTEKPTNSYMPPLQIPGRLIEHTNKRVPFTYICRIGLDGRATDIHIIDTPYPKAVPAIMRFVKNCRFTVAKKDGKPVQCIVKRRGTYIPASSKNPFIL